MARPRGLPKRDRLRSKKDISEVFRSGRYHPLGILHAKSLPTGREGTRFLISVKRMVGNAPRRNRIKRLVREAMRKHRHEIDQAHDICFFLTRRPPVPPEWPTIEAEIQHLITRLAR